jgi:predicted TIM-barrel fold metal-dependent hydrolase
MLIDVNAYLGHWPFRQLRHNTPAKLLRLMDRKGIDRALVSSIDAIFYKNPQPANEELARSVRRHADRLIPLAVINPTYADWTHDLATCVELGFRGLRLYPSYHAYSLADACCDELVRAAVERGLILSIPIRQTDSRQRHWLIDIPDVSLDAVAALVARHPQARVVLLNGIGYPRSRLGQADGGLPANYLIEISRLTALMRSEIGALIDNVGAERLAFGTGMPFKYVDPPLVKLEVLDATRAEKDRIRSRNIAAWLR